MSIYKPFFIISLLVLMTCQNNQAQDFKIETLTYPDSLHIIRRADWGWKPLQRILPEQKIHYITIHHGGETFDRDRDPVEYIRHLQDWSRSEKKWIDIPYHFMIDLQGRIYETRPINYPGDTNTSYNPRGHALICMIGNYENITVSKQQLKSLIDLTAFLANTYHVPIKDIRGHKDYTETLCPGKNLYKYLKNGYIRQQVARQLH